MQQPTHSSLPCIAIIGIGQMGLLFTKYACKFAEKVVCYDSSLDQIESLFSRLETSRNPFDINEPTQISNEDIKKIVPTSNIDDVWNSDPTLTVIATHKETHCHYSCEAMLHGSHVLVEKPIAPTLKEVEKMYDVSIERQKKIFIEFSLHEFPVFKQIKHLRNNNFFNSLKKYSITRIGAVPKEYKAKVSADFDLLAHDVDFCLQLFGKPQSIAVTSKTWRDNIAVWKYQDFEIIITSLMPEYHPNGFEYNITMTNYDDSYLHFTSNNPNYINIFNSNGQLTSSIYLKQASPYLNILHEVINSIPLNYETYLSHPLSVLNGMECQKVLVKRYDSVN